MASHFLLCFFVIVALVFVATADGGGGYKLLEYDEELSTHPWQNLVQRARTPLIQRRRYHTSLLPPNDTDPNSNASIQNKRKSSLDETNELNNFLKDSGVNFIYSRIPMPVVLVSSYQKPKH